MLFRSWKRQFSRHSRARHPRLEELGLNGEGTAAAPSSDVFAALYVDLSRGGRIQDPHAAWLTPQLLRPTACRRFAQDRPRIAAMDTDKYTKANSRNLDPHGLIRRWWR